VHEFAEAALKLNSTSLCGFSAFGVGLQLLKAILTTAGL
jgi:hypothetical protein